MNKAYPELSSQCKDNLVIKRNGNKYSHAYSNPIGHKKSYVYFVISNLELIYIGKGTDDRWQHSQSGKSHNKFINEYHKNYGNKCYLVANNLSSKAAYAIELKLIKTLRPLANIDDNPIYMNFQKGIKRLYKNHLSVLGYGSKKKTKSTIRKCKNR